ncbi:DUF6344 domain-containing protein [Streptomyces longwoodensis]|uniref:DUF6344 domain-containing protein n=1 Tax=Streptomyces longwoodensis TaxID=68231 RepID=UPI00324EFF9F
MAKTEVMKLWTAIVTAFLALCTALGLVTTTSATAVAQTEPTRNSSTGENTDRVTIPAQAALPWAWSRARALPPTMKQRIRAEAHGKSPSCRHRPLADAESQGLPDAAHPDGACDDSPAADSRMVPLQR